jgi:hypothetical protein
VLGTPWPSAVAHPASGTGTLGTAAATPAKPTPAAVNAVTAATAKPNFLMVILLGYRLG